MTDTRRPPLSPAAQAVLENAKLRPWPWPIDEENPSRAPVIDDVWEAIAASVNAYARDRELLAMAWDALEHFADRRRAEMGGLHPGQDENDRGCLCVWCLTRRVLAARGTEAES